MADLHNLVPNPAVYSHPNEIHNLKFYIATQYHSKMLRTVVYPGYLLCVWGYGHNHSRGKISHYGTCLMYCRVCVHKTSHCYGQWGIHGITLLLLGTTGGYMGL